MGLGSVVRWMRAAVFAATCAGLATLGHVAGGGSFSRLAATVGFLVVLVPALALTGRERTLRSIMGATALAQAVLHTLLSQAALNPADSSLLAAPGGVSAMDGMEHGSPGLGMLLMHVVSVLVTSAWLEWGEARLCALTRHLAGRALRPLLFLLAVIGRHAGPLPQALPELADERPPAWTVLRHSVVRRGPPLGRRAALQ